MSKRVKYIIQAFLLLWGLTGLTQAQSMCIDQFAVKENLTQNGKLALVALDSTGNPLERINGTFVFSLNGFQQDLVFHDGVAVVQQPLESSTFVFFTHSNQQKTINGLYYIHKKDGELKPFEVNTMWLLLIPIAILLIAYIFRKFLATFVILALVYAYFHFSKGLDFSRVLDSILDTLRNLI